MRAKNAEASLPPAPFALITPKTGLDGPPTPLESTAGLNGPPANRPALLLACGNSLRQDDGVGLRIAEAAEQLFPASRLRIVAAEQFTPEMAVDLAEAALAIFVDACVTDEPGAIRIAPVAARNAELESHRLDPPAMLALAEALCGRAPARAFAVTIGAGSLGYGEEMTGPLRQAVPRALRLLESLVAQLTT